MKIKIPTEDVVNTLHDEVLIVSGGREGTLNANVASGAVKRPQLYVDFVHEYSVHTVCALLLDSLARNHAYVEGNKRTALMTVLLTYEMNGMPVSVRGNINEDYEDLVLWVVLDKPEIPEVENRLKKLYKKYSK